MPKVIRLIIKQLVTKDIKTIKAKPSKTIVYQLRTPQIIPNQKKRNYHKPTTKVSSNKPIHFKSLIIPPKRSNNLT